MVIDKRGIPFMNCYMAWCATNLKSFTYDHYPEFIEYLDKEYDILWNGVNSIMFKEPAVETAFLLRWS